MHARKSERRERLVPGQGTKVNFDFCPYDSLKIEAETEAETVSGSSFGRSQEDGGVPGESRHTHRSPRGAI